MWTSQVYGHHDKIARTKTHRKSQTRSIQRRNIHKEITIFFVFFGFFCCFFIFNFQLLKGLLQKMLNYRLGTVNEKHWGFKPVFRCCCCSSKPHTFSTFSVEEKEKKRKPKSLSILPVFSPKCITRTSLIA